MRPSQHTALHLSLLRTPLVDSALCLRLDLILQLYWQRNNFIAFWGTGITHNALAFLTREFWTF